jgi:hypothetical protein
MYSYATRKQRSIDITNTNIQQSIKLMFQKQHKDSYLVGPRDRFLELFETLDDLREEDRTLEVLNQHDGEVHRGASDLVARGLVCGHTTHGTGVSGAKYMGAQSLALCATLGGRADLLGVLCRHGATVAGPVPAEALIAHPKPNEHFMMAGKGACPVALAARVVDTFAGNNGANEMQGAITHGVPR